MGKPAKRRSVSGPARLNYSRLLQRIAGAHRELQQRAAVAVNQALVLRNWLIGAWLFYRLYPQLREALPVGPESEPLALACRALIAEGSTGISSPPVRKLTEVDRAALEKKAKRKP